VTRSARLVALSGYGQREDWPRAFGTGFDDHLPKPADPERLASIIAGAPGRARPVGD
jgi:CheY-like chemotaxis protein